MANSTSTRFNGLQNGILANGVLALAYVIVAVSFFLGALFLYEGLGFDFRILDYPAIKAYGVPIGILLLALGVVTARLWIVEWGQEDRDQRLAIPPPRGVMPKALSHAQLGAPPAAPANENRAPDIGVRGLAQAGQRYRSQRTLDAYDATSSVGLRTVVHNGAIESMDDRGELKIDLPNLGELRAAAAVLRCLLPVRLRGREMLAIRSIMGLNLAGLLGRLGEQAPSELLSRWETEDLNMDELTERRFRQAVCKELGAKAPHLEFDVSEIAKFKIVDPWRMNPTYEVPPVVLNWVQIKEESGSVSRAWNDKWVA